MSRYSYIAISEKASHKETNEDRIFINGTLLNSGNITGLADDEMVAVVCDGVGGVSGGEIAATEAASSFALFDKNHLTYPALDRHILRTNNAIRDMQKKDHLHSSMATTIAGLIINKDNYMVFNLGDSRVYRYSNKILTLLTHDHTVAQEKLNCGVLSDIEDATPTDRNTLTRYIGGCDEVSVPFAKYGAISKADEFFLLCSDGISKSLSDNQICCLLSSNQNIQHTAEGIMCAAIQNGCTDDCSIILIRVFENNDMEEKI